MKEPTLNNIEEILNPMVCTFPSKLNIIIKIINASPNLQNIATLASFLLTGLRVWYSVKINNKVLARYITSIESSVILFTVTKPIREVISCSAKYKNIRNRNIEPATFAAVCCEWSMELIVISIPSVFLNS